MNNLSVVRRITKDMLILESPENIVSIRIEEIRLTRYVKNEKFLRIVSIYGELSLYCEPEEAEKIINAMGAYTIQIKTSE